jgi:hypothetical protein
MVSTKNLFLGVYMENGILRLLFLPLCYLLLSAPLSLLVARYFKLDQKPKEFFLAALTNPDAFPQISIACLIIFYLTRRLSGGGNDTVNGKRRVQLLPFWVPGVRHWFNVVLGGEKWLEGVRYVKRTGVCTMETNANRESSVSPVIGYSSSGMKHNVVFSAPLLDQILGNSDSLDEADITKWVTKRNGFALPKSAKKQYLELSPSLSEAFGSEIFKGKQLKNITSASLRILTEALPDLVTFNSSIVDQLQWERVAGVELTDGTDEVETDLFALINEFFSTAILTPITGPQFTESYELLATDLSTFNQSYFPLVLGFPRFFPLPGLPSASLSQKRLLREFSKHLKQLTDPPTRNVTADDESTSGNEETDAESPTPLSALNDLFSKHNLPLSARASIAAELIHRIVAQAVPLAFWTILHINHISASAVTDQEKEQSPLNKIRQETKDWAQAIQPPSIHEAFPSPPQISFTSGPALFNPSSFPFLRSCIFEAKRLYASSITTAKVMKSIEFTDNTVPGKEEEWWLEAGTYLDVGLSQRLINTSPANYLSPESYNPNRFATSQPPAPLSSSVFDDSDELVTSLLVAFVAGVVQLWDIQAAPKKGFMEQMQEAQAAAVGEDNKKIQGGERKFGTWEVPKTIDGASVLVPKGDVKVRIRRREGLPSAKTTRKGK